MNQSKFSLADVLTVLSALAFGFVCFMGANFLNINNYTVWGMPHTTGCIVMALVCSGLLFVTSFGAKLLKRTSRNFKSSFIWEVVLLMLFVLFAAFFTSRSSPFPHFFTVTAKRSEINSKLQKSITQAEKMFTEYEAYAENRKNLYKSNLTAIANSNGTNHIEFAKYGFENNGIPFKDQINNKMFTVNADLFPSNYSNPPAKNGIKQVATNWLKSAKNTTSGWKPIGIVSIVNDIEKNSTQWKNTLVSFSQVREKGEVINDFYYPLSFANVKTHFTKLEKPALDSISIAVVSYVLMLLSWFVTKRSTRFPGLKLLFSLGKSSDNEL